MSVQLVLYPQIYEGQYSSTSTPVFNEYVADNVTFNSLLLESGTLSSFSRPEIEALNLEPADYIWRRFASETGGGFSTVDMPTRTLTNGLELFSANVPTVGSLSGVYQLITNLVINTVYDFTINITQGSATGLIEFGSVFGSLLTGTPPDFLGGNYNTAIPATLGTQTLTFTADGTEEILLLNYFNDNGDTIYIDSISIKESASVPTLIYTDLDNGQVICDLYEEEDIPLSLSIDNFKNVAEKIQSYSKDFNLPATKRNNKIFTHIFEITKIWDSNSFNPYRKTKCILKENGIDIFSGYLRLIDIITKNGETSYNVNLYSDTITFLNIIESKNFSHLTVMSELDHVYNKSNVKDSWDSTGILLANPLGASSFAGAYNDTRTQVLKYPFVDWTGNIAIATPSTTNWIVGNPALESLEQAFRPFIQCKYILKNIFNDAGFTYTSSFLESNDFTKLFMDFNWGEGNAPSDFESSNNIGYRYKASEGINFATSNFTPLWLNRGTANLPIQAGWTNYKFTAPNSGVTYFIDYLFKLEWAANTDFVMRWEHKDSSGNIYPLGSINETSASYNSQGSGNVFTGNFTRTLASGDTLEAVFKKLAGTVSQSTDTFSNSAAVVVEITNQSTTSSSLINNIRGDLSQAKFFTGIVNMFNLVILQDKTNSNNLLIEPYDKIFNITTSGTSLNNRSIQHDWTNKIDIAEIKLSPLELIKQTNFKYEDDNDDYTFNQYKNSKNGFKYGSYKFDAYSQGFTLLEGEDEITAAPFAATLVKPLFGLFPDFIIPSIFSSNDDNSENESFDNAPRILFNNGKKITNTSYYIPEQAGFSSENQEYFLQFSHLTDIPTDNNTKDYNFGACQLINPVGNPPADNLFTTYWSRYYFELYDVNTRVMVLKVNLTPADLANFEFNHKIMIKNKEFRVNKIEYKANDLSTVEFILIP